MDLLGSNFPCTCGVPFPLDDTQRNRINAANAMSRATQLASNRQLDRARTVLEEAIAQMRSDEAGAAGHQHETSLRLRLGAHGVKRN